MKLLIGTPAYGGMISNEYLVSMITSVRGFIRDQVDFTVFTIANESLINRGRNTIAMAAMEGGYDKLLFIDADISWNYADMCHILNSDKPIIGGLYPLKTYPICMNFNPLPDHFQVFESEGKEGKVYQKTLDKLKVYKEKYANEKGEVEVLHVPTGFMSIHTSVFQKLKDQVPVYNNRDFHTGKMGKAYEFFPVRVKNSILESEDWAFCSVARDNDIPVYINTNVLLPHAGTHVFGKAEFSGT